tara:strand:- start:179 stop:736 length:558 start_codon:yes stop_codon:yes gene_type:complete
MRLSEKDSHFFSISFSVIAHLLLLLIVVPELDIRKKAPEKTLRIPVQMVMTKEKAVVKKAPVKKKLKSTKKKLSRKVAKKKKAKPTPPQPMPGDRAAPVLSQKSTPIYPKKALNNEWEGTVIVEILVSKLGKPLRVKIIQSSGYVDLDQSFVRTIKNYYSFDPKRVSGQDQRGTIQLSYSFSLDA